MFRFINKKLLAGAGIILFLALGIAATPVPAEDPEFKNLKVIPKNIDEEQMERIMHKISQNLGVTCSYCHPDTKPGIFPMRVDFVSDEIPAKNIARKMMLMTDKVNKKYFAFKNNYSLEAMNNRTVISCNTCHRGLPKPNSSLIIPE